MSHSEDDILYARAKNLFLRALELPPEVRPRFLSEQCHGNPRLEEHVRQLLRHHEEDADSWNPESLRASALERMIGAGIRFGAYELGDVIGRGGMGIVYRAVDRRDRRTVALKVISPLSETAEHRARFSQEAEVLQRLNHPGICRLLETGQVETPAGPLAYFSMELVLGRSLRQYLEQDDPDERERLRFLLAIVDAVEHAHARGITHRDIKPENILVRGKEDPVLLDFGIAHLTGYRSTTTMRTRTGRMLGTLRYMSPEQARGESVDERSDVYSLGILSHEILSGRLPYAIRSKADTALLLEIVSPEPVILSEDLPGNVRAWLARALEKDCDQRYALAGAMREDLEKVIERRHVPGTRRRWLQRRARRLLKRNGAGIAAAAILVAAAAAALMVQHDYTRQATRSEARLVALMESADRAIHHGSRTQEGLLRALEDLDAARLALTSLPDRPYTSQVRRFLDWRAGEASYFLGLMQHDAEWFLEADAQWASADRYRDESGSLELLPAPGQLRANIRHLGAHHPQSGRGLAHAALALHRQPLQHWRQAAHYFHRSLGLWAHRWNLERDPFNTPFLNPLIVHDLGSAMVHWGVVADSLALVEEGLATLHRVAADSLWENKRDAQAAYQHSLATGYLACWHGMARADDLDQAEAHLDRAAVLRNPLYGNLNYIYTMRDLATVHLERARSRIDVAEQEVHLRAAFEALRAAQGRIGGLELRFESAEMQYAEAEVLLWMASQGERLGIGPTQALSRAGEHLDAAATVFRGSIHPLQWAHVQRARAHLHEIAFVQTGDATELQRASDLIRAAQRVVPDVEHTRFARSLIELSARLAGYEEPR